MSVSNQKVSCLSSFLIQDSGWLLRKDHPGFLLLPTVQRVIS